MRRTSKRPASKNLEPSAVKPTFLEALGERIYQAVMDVDSDDIGVPDELDIAEYDARRLLAVLKCGG